MPLSDLAVFTEHTNDISQQVVAQQTALFNEASAGAIVLRPGQASGDFSEARLWAKLNGLVRRRNPYGSGSIPKVNLRQLTENMVRVAAGSPEVELDPGQFRYIRSSPEEAGAIMGQQLGQQMVLDMFNTAVVALLTSHLQVAGLIADRTGKTVKTLNQGSFNSAQRIMGDNFRDILAWLLPSASLFDLYGDQLKNSEKLYDFGTLGVSRDFIGRTIIHSDIPALTVPATAAPTPEYRYALGLKPAAVVVEQNDDFDDQFVGANGNENIKRSYQAEWTYNLGVRGFNWDKANGGKAPTDAALQSAPNWDRVSGYADKDLGAVIIKTQAAADD